MTRKAYQSDVSDTEWQIIKPLLPESQPIGRPREVDLREIVNAIFGRATRGMYLAWTTA